MFEAKSFRRAPSRLPAHVPLQISPLAGRLSLSDQAEFIRLMSHFACSDERNRRNLGLSTFVKHLGMIHSFVCRGDSFDALRGAVCGIEFGQQSFLINTRQLKKLMCRSKSCMNGCFQRLGYAVCRPARDLGALFAQVFSRRAAQVFSSRQWCVRRAGESSVVTFAPNLTVEIASAEPAKGEQTDGAAAHPCDVTSLLNPSGRHGERGAEKP
jgi:hypothetical protein